MRLSPCTFRFFCLPLLLVAAGCSTTRIPGFGVLVAGHKPSVYTVRAGDTLIQIGKKFDISYRLLARRNRLHPPYTIYVGQHLYLTDMAPRSRALPVARRTYRKPKRLARKRHLKKSARSSNRARTSGYAKGSLLWPVKGVLTSKFGRRASRMHDGIDIAAKAGTSIHAAAAGEVVYADKRLSGYGRLVIIRHQRNLFTVYAHNQRNLARKGSKVRAGDVIARVGQSGRASGPHLHFEVRQGSTPVDPLAYLRRR
jgi:lipoprotein NlpD